jgi:ketose-bisphosphate aldolase
MLKSARDHHFTVGGFNIVNMETVQAVVRSASRAGSPVIIQVYHRDLAHAGAKYLAALADAAAAESSIPVCMSLDHGQSYQQAVECIDAGFSGVMIDLSTEDFDKNVESTRRVVEYAHKRGVSVEAELGKIFDADKPVDVRNSAMTDPDVARKFVKLTRVDSLAVSVGTAHGMYSTKPRIDFELLKELVSTIDIPIVVHGGSNTPDPDVLEIVRLGVAKLNIGTDLMRAFNKGLMDSLAKGGEGVPVSDALGNARSRVEAVVDEKLKLLNNYRR